MIAVCLALAAFPVIPPPVFTGLDPAWALGLNIAHAQKLVHGRDLVWTFGPLGYLSYPVAGIAGMYPVLIYRLGVYLLWCVALFRLSLLPRGIRYWVVLVVAFAAVLDPLVGADHLAIALFTWCLLVLVDRSSWRIAGLIVIAVLAALACTIKANSGVVAICLFGALLIGLFFEDYRLFLSLRRPIAIAALLLPLLVLVLYASETRTLASFPAYIRYSLDVASGYSEAMSLPGDPTQAWVAVGGVVILFLLLPWFGRPVLSLAPGYPLALVYAFFAFKYGMVRQDAHAADFELQLALAALFLVVVARGKWFVWLTLAFQIACLLYTAHVTSGIWPQTPQVVASRLSIVGNWPAINGFLHWPQTWTGLERQSRINLEPLRVDPELQSLIGRNPVEAIPWNVSLVRENGWTWDPRPVFQTYAAYTPTLDRINADYLQGSRAAAFTLVGWAPIDERHPFLETPLSWQAQLDRYQAVTADPDLLVLRRRSTARFQSLEPVAVETTSWDRSNRVPQSGDPMVVSAHIGKSLKGRLMTLLFRLNPLYIEVTRQSGTTERYRALRANFADGVILNQLPETLGDLAVLATPGCSISDPVVSFRLQTGSPAEFDPDIRLEWSRLVSRPEAPGNCVQLGLPSAQIPVWGGAGRVPVSAGAGISWTATSNQPWVSVETEGPRAGNAAARYSVLGNSGLPRQAALSIGGRIFTISQPGLQAPTPSQRTSVQLGFYHPAAFATDPPRQPGFDLIVARFAPLLPDGQPVIGDWTGDGRMRIGIFHNGTWFLDLNGNRRWDGKGGGDGVFTFGQPGDIAVPGDWAGDGKTRLAVFRGGQWIIDRNGNMAWDRDTEPIVPFGLPGDIPVVARWGVGHADRAGIFRSGTWIVDSTGGGAAQPGNSRFEFGLAGDIPLVSFGTGNIGVFRNGACLLAPKGARSFEASNVISVPCPAPPLIAAW